MEIDCLNYGPNVVGVIVDGKFYCADCDMDIDRTEEQCANDTPIYSTDEWFTSDKCVKCKKTIRRPTGYPNQTAA